MSDTKHAPDSNGEEYNVGYGRPPTATRFQPGRSGNPRGRPKGRKTLIALVRTALEQPVMAITENGVTRPMSFKEAIARNLVKNGCQQNSCDKATLPALGRRDRWRPSFRRSRTVHTKLRGNGNPEWRVGASLR